MVDGGVNGGSNLVTTLCLGADFCFVRAAVCVVTAGGRAGASRAVEILSHELQIILRRLGCADVAELGLDHLVAIT